jgi:hypothetical protein
VLLQRWCGDELFEQMLESQRRYHQKRKQAKAAAVSTSSSPAPSSLPAQSLAELEARTKAVDEDQTEARAWGFTGVPFDLCAPPPPELLDEQE